MTRSLAHRIGPCCLTALLVCASPSGQALNVCAAPPQPQSHTAAFDDRLFQHNGADLSARGRAQLSDYAHALEPATLEVVVISVPAPVLANAEAPQALAQQRALAVREQLARGGVPRERIYTEQRRTTLAPQLAGNAPVLIETIAAAPRLAATGRGWRCVASAAGQPQPTAMPAAPL